MAKRSNVPIIVKKVKGHSGPSHHGGAWKVAYADFVTAMMAFFLLLWLLNVTTDIQKRGIADYFEPTIASKSQSGAGGVMGGETMGQPGAQTLPTSAPSLALDRPALRQPDEGDEGDEGGTPSRDKTADQDNPAPGQDQMQTDKPAAPDQSQQTAQLSDEAAERQLAEREAKRFATAEYMLRQAVAQDPELKALAQNLIIDETPEGLRVQLVDQDKQAMFALGSAELLEPTKKLIAVITQVVQRLPNKVTITGHTDAIPYAGGGRYTNWELSADRANASRREFIADGLPEDRIARVGGVAERDPLLPDQPTSPRNRRISIVLLREAKEPPPKQAAAR
ncbi:MAG TPA: flagellar motor protein MotB [Stellaceae bacterium]|nr:flagellar motor protein MotB [Stellaceae bacterium]